MKKYILLLAFITLLVNICKAQDETTLNCRNFVLTIEFHPAFLAPGRLVLENNGGTNTLTLENIYSSKDFSIRNQTGLTRESSDSMLIDKKFRSYYGETTLVEHLERVTVSGKDFKNFRDSLSSINLTKQTSLMKDNINDGITIYLRYKPGSTVHDFNLRCPDPYDTAEFKIIKALFNLMESSFHSQLATNYIENLKGYFRFGLLVKHIADNPLEYRFYGALSENEKDEFYKFMERLPKDKPVIFDFSNFDGMGTMFYDDFEDFININHNVYWLVNDFTKLQIKAIGVKSKRMFKDRQALLKKINTEN